MKQVGSGQPVPACNQKQPRLPPFLDSAGPLPHRVPVSGPLQGWKVCKLHNALIRELRIVVFITLHLSFFLTQASSYGGRSRKLISLGAWELPCRRCRLHRWQAAGEGGGWWGGGGPQPPLSVPCAVDASIRGPQGIYCVLPISKSRGEGKRQRPNTDPKRPRHSISENTVWVVPPATRAGHAVDKGQREGRLDTPSCLMNGTILFAFPPMDEWRLCGRHVVSSCRLVPLGLIQAANFHSCSWPAPFGALAGLELEFPGFFFQIFSPDFPSNSRCYLWQQAGLCFSWAGQDQVQITLTSLRAASWLMGAGGWVRGQGGNNPPSTAPRITQQGFCLCELQAPSAFGL